VFKFNYVKLKYFCIASDTERSLHLFLCSGQPLILNHGHGDISEIVVSHWFSIMDMEIYQR